MTIQVNLSPQILATLWSGQQRISPEFDIGSACLHVVYVQILRISPEFDIKTKEPAMTTQFKEMQESPFAVAVVFFGIKAGFKWLQLICTL